jgi:hypothetical protein
LLRTRPPIELQKLHRFNFQSGFPELSLELVDILSAIEAWLCKDPWRKLLNSRGLSGVSAFDDDDDDDYDDAG